MAGKSTKKTGKKTGRKATRTATKKKTAKKPPAVARQGASTKATSKPAGSSESGGDPTHGGAASSADRGSASRRIDQRIAELDDWRGERLAEIRALIREADPEVVEDWKWMGTPVWSHEGMYALANAHKDKVKLTFHHGAELPDPKGLFNAGLGGKKWRAIDLYEGDAIDRSALKALVKAAVAHNTTHSVPRSRGSRA
jgi:hypothetical protein